MASPVDVADFQFYLKDNSADGDYLDLLQQFLDATYEAICGIVRYDYAKDNTISYRFWGNGLNSKQVPVLTGDTATMTLTETYRNEAAVPVGSSEFWLVDRLLFISTRFYSTRHYLLTIKTNKDVPTPSMILQVNMEWAFHLLEKSRRGIGSLGKVTDFSNVLGQSSLRYQTDSVLLNRFESMLTSLIVY